MHEVLKNLEKVHNRRKALVWVSEGYDFNPFQDVAARAAAIRLRRSCRTTNSRCATGRGTTTDSS